MSTSDQNEALPDTCPSCGNRGKPVKPVTIESLVVEAARARVGAADGFHFCAEPSCDVSYFHPESGARIGRFEVRVRIGQKVAEAPRPICYCFDHTLEEIEGEVAATGSSKVAHQITEKCRQGLDRCEVTNPQGSCCLGNVRRAIKVAHALRLDQSAPAVITQGEVEGADCCLASTVTATAPARPRNAGFWLTNAAVVSAILSSTCCWLPLLLIAFGASAAGIAGFFEAYRPHLLGITGLLLAGSFYLVRFRKARCGPGEACAVPNLRLRRLNTVVLWVATTVVLGVALFPNYVGYLLGGGSPPASAVATGEREFRIAGMTCEACAATLGNQLSNLPGVARAEVSFDAKVARVFFVTRDSGPSDEIILARIRKAGYTGLAVAKGSSRVVRIDIAGMTCASCAIRLQIRLAGLPDVTAATVDYASASATVTLSPRGSLATVLTAIAEDGFEGREVARDGVHR